MSSDWWDKWPEADAKRLFEQIEQMRVHAPGNFEEQLEFSEAVEAVMALLDTSEKPRELLLEAWLLVDYITSYLLRDGLGIPHRIDETLKLLPFQFDKKLGLIQKLRVDQAKLLPNQKSYSAFELHPDFQALLMKEPDFYRELLKKAAAFERKVGPKEPVALVRNDYETSRYVPEWWFRRVNALDDEWFKTCRQLNSARNIAAHKMKMTGSDIFSFFGVETLNDFRDVLKKTINSLVFKPER